MPLIGDWRLRFADNFTPAQQAIFQLLSSIAGATDCPGGKEGHQEFSGAWRMNFLTTNYDAVVEAIVDSANAQPAFTSRGLYRGFTPVAYCGDCSAQSLLRARAGGLLLKLNGGFEVFRAGKHFEVDYRCRDDDALRANPPQIMLPSRAQDYDQPYFLALFPKAVRLLQESAVVVLVGYGFPEEDALIRLLLRQFAEAPSDGRQRELYYIDLEDEGTQLARVLNVFPHAHNSGGLSVVPWQGDFSDWCRAVLDCM
jgi:hypothetical protein